ncbi:MAG: hypothetical protein ACOC7K_02495, partial [bacterium]
EEVTTIIHVMKPLTIRRVGVWHEDALSQTAEEWDDVQESDGESSLDGATYALYELPKASSYTEWIRYYIVGGAVADPRGTWAEKTEPDPKLLWWSQRLHLGSNKIEYLAEYNGLLLSHAREDDGKVEAVTWLKFVNPTNPSYQEENDSDDIMLRARDPKTNQLVRVRLCYDADWPDNWTLETLELVFLDDQGERTDSIGLPKKRGDKLVATWDGRFGTKDRGFHYKDLSEHSLRLQAKFKGDDTAYVSQTHTVTDLVYKHRPIVKLTVREDTPSNILTMMTHSSIQEWVFVLRRVRSSPPRPSDFEWIRKIVDPDGAPTTPGEMRIFNCGKRGNPYFMTDKQHDPDWRPGIKQPAYSCPDKHRVYHITEREGDFAFIQYWFFMTFSRLPADGGETFAPHAGQLFHQGDWEMFQIAIRIDGKSPPVPVGCTASQHYYAQTLRWDQKGNGPAHQNQDHVERQGDQPVVYVAKGSHATYFRAGCFNTTTSPSGRDPKGNFVQYTEPAASPWGMVDVTGKQIELAVKTKHLEHVNEYSMAKCHSGIVNTWQGYWGWKNHPGIIVLGGALPLSGTGDGSVSPRWRGPGQMKGSDIIIQENPKRFHNDYVKPTQREALAKGGILLP